MRADETNMGGPDRAFLETATDMVAGLHSPDPLRYTSAFDVFCKNYWKPAYVYIRSAWAKGNEDAKDLTQAFFLWLSENDALKKFEPDRGSLRRYLRVLLRSFVGHREDALGRLKRGGASTLLSLDAGPAEFDAILSDPRSTDPEAAYDRAWRSTVILQAIGRLSRRCATEGRIDSYRLFENYDLMPEAVRPTYKDLAARYRVEEAEVKKRLLAMREELRAEIHAELTRCGVGDGDIDCEWSFIFESWGGSRAEPAREVP